MEANTGTECNAMAHSHQAQLACVAAGLEQLDRVTLRMTEHVRGKVVAGAVTSLCNLVPWKAMNLLVLVGMAVFWVIQIAGIAKVRCSGQSFMHNSGYICMVVRAVTLASCP